MNLSIQNMSGAGNLFNIIDNRLYNFTQDDMRKLVPQIASKTKTNEFQTEGIMFIDESDECDFRVSFFNNDGSSGMMCGNGGRCAVRFAQFNDFFEGKEVDFFMSDSCYSANITNDVIILNMPDPKQTNSHIKYALGKRLIDCGYYDVGSDHLVVMDANLDIDFFDDLSFIELAKSIRSDFDNFPKGVNVNLYSLSKNYVLIKTFERGIERITGACGTGAISTAIHCNVIHGWSAPIKLIPPSSSVLEVNFLLNNDKASHVTLTGSAEFLEIISIDI